VSDDTYEATGFETCDICGFPLSGTMIGHGDGTGNRFAHPACYWQERAEKAEDALAAIAQASARPTP
jgi:hypothetical protein